VPAMKTKSGYDAETVARGNEKRKDGFKNPIGENKLIEEKGKNWDRNGDRRGEKCTRRSSKTALEEIRGNYRDEDENRN